MLQLSRNQQSGAKSTNLVLYSELIISDEEPPLDVLAPHPLNARSGLF